MSTRRSVPGTRRSVPTLLPCALVAAAAMSGACSLLLPFGDLGESADASNDGVDAPTADDSGVREGGPQDARDDGADSAVGPGDAPFETAYPDGSWCAMQPPGMSLCDDFDYETTNFERWDRFEFDIQGTASFSTVAESLPHSFLLSVPQVQPNTFYIEALVQDVSGDASTKTLSVSFAFQPFPALAQDSGVTTLILGIAQGPGAPRNALGIKPDPYGTALIEQVTAVDGGTFFPQQAWAPVPLPGGKFTRIDLLIDFTVPKATLSFDGTKLYDDPLLGSWSASAKTTVYLGDWYVITTPGFGLRYDDVVIRAN